MSKLIVTALITLSLIFPGRAGAQAAPDPDAIAAVKELVIAMRATEQFKLVMPQVMQAMKRAALAGHPEMEPQFDAISAVLLEAASTRVDEVSDQIVGIYARHFTADELRQLTAFYHAPVGQKLLQAQPAIAQESLAVGQNWAHTIATEMQGQINEELRKRGIKP
jgi:uncharacterized protein